MSHIRVHELAGQLGVTPQEVISILLTEGTKVRGPSTVVAESVAARVRRRLRSVDSAGSPTFEPEPLSRPPVGAAIPDTEKSATRREEARGVVAERQGTRAPRMSPETMAPAFSGPSLFLEPGVERPVFERPGPAGGAAAGSGYPPPSNVARIPAQRQPLTKLPGAMTVPPLPVPTVPAVTSARSMSTRRPPAAQMVPLARSVPAPAPPQNHESWRSRGISAERQDDWLAAGLTSGESALADRCDSAGIEPGELAVRLSGRTALQRLRDGESVTSVWARIQEAGQQVPRKGTRLTGRFRQLG